MKWRKRSMMIGARSGYRYSKWYFMVVEGLLFVLLQHVVMGQTVEKLPRPEIILSRSLSITYNKTTLLIFPFPIQWVDRGTKEIMARIAGKTDNVLEVKAGVLHFTQTSLSVITSDGKLYSFIVNYDPAPIYLNYWFGKKTPKFQDKNEKTSNTSPVSFSRITMNEGELKACSKLILSLKKEHPLKIEKKDGMVITLYGIFIKRDVLFFKLAIRNNSNISYTIGDTRFYTVDQKRAKRTASQEVEINPLYEYWETNKIRGRSTQFFVFAMHKFTLPDKRYFILEMGEKGGARNLKIRVKNKTIEWAKLVS